MVRVFPLVTDAAGCYLYRIYWPLTHLDPAQFHIVWGTDPSVDAAAGDVVVGQRLAGPDPAWLDLCQRPDLRCVYEIDDDIIDVDPANEVPYNFFAPRRDGTIRNIAAAHVVTASTPHLAEKIRSRWNPNVVVLPNCLPREWYDAPDWHRRDGSITVGWAGSPFHAHDWPGVGQQLAKLAAAAPRVRFATIGADYLSPHVKVASSVGFTTNSHLLSLLDFDIGIAPLARSDFNRSKSWAKLLEYGARNAAVVATGWGQYPQWFDLGGGSVDPPGILVEEPEGFFDALNTLVEDEGLRRSYQDAGRVRAVSMSIETQVHLWAGVYREAR